MDVPWKHHTTSKKPDTEDHILYDFIYMRCPEYTNLETECKFMVDEGWDGGNRGTSGVE